MPNRVQTEGSNPATGAAIIVDSFAWAKIERSHDLLSRIDDGNIMPLNKLLVGVALSASVDQVGRMDQRL